MTLLERALVVKTSKYGKRGPFSEEELELIMAWMTGDIGFAQVNVALGVGNTSCYVFLATGMRELYRRGKIAKVKHE